MTEAPYNHNFTTVFAGSEDWMRVRISTVRRQVQRFVVQYETKIADKEYGMVRYDCAHDFIHRDTLNHRGDVVEKQPVREQVNCNRALHEAIADVRAERRWFRADFIRRLPKD